MSKVSAGMGGRGTAVSIERKEHPPNHFELHRMEIEKAKGGFTVRHHVKLKAKHDKSENYYGGYKEPETHVVADSAALMEHVAKHMGGGKKKASDNDGDE